MLDAAKLIEWSDEAARSDDFVIASLLLHLATLKNLSDHRTVEICRNYASMKAREGAAAHQAEEWPDLIGVEPSARNL